MTNMYVDFLICNRFWPINISCFVRSPVNKLSVSDRVHFSDGSLNRNHICLLPIKKKNLVSLGRNCNMKIGLNDFSLTALELTFLKDCKDEMNKG